MFVYLFQIIQRCPDNLIHIIIPVLAQSSAEDHVALLFGKRLIAGIQRSVFGVVHRIVGLHARLPFGGIFPADDGSGLCAEFKMLVLNNPGIRLLPGGIVYNGVALEVFHGQLLGFKPDAAVFQRAQPVAEEAALTAEALGNRVVRLYDVGVAGLHRLLAHLDEIMSAQVIVAIAGMEGALASVIGGLADRPVIAVPTSVGYGASLGGLSALLSMLNSCASGVSVVNIDNGFGAAYQASLINHMEVKG